MSKNELKRTGLVETIRGIDEIDPEKYLAVLKEVPQMEQLAKAGLPLLVKECVANYYPFKEYFKNHGTGNLAKMLGTDTQGLKRLRENKGGQQFLRWLQYEKPQVSLCPTMQSVGSAVRKSRLMISNLYETE